MTQYSNEEIIDNFLDHVRYLKVKHHVNGRIRVKASWSGARKLASVKEGELETIIAGIPGIGEYRVNRKALSVIIEYNPDVLPFSLWEEVGTLGEYPANRENIRTQLLDIMNRA
jgi:hypothetical protein